MLRSSSKKKLGNTADENAASMTTTSTAAITRKTQYIALASTYLTDPELLKIRSVCTDLRSRIDNEYERRSNLMYFPATFNPYNNATCFYFARTNLLDDTIEQLTAASMTIPAMTASTTYGYLASIYLCFNKRELSGRSIIKKWETEAFYSFNNINYNFGSPFYFRAGNLHNGWQHITLAELIASVAGGVGIQLLARYTGLRINARAIEQAQSAWKYLTNNNILRFLPPDEHRAFRPVSSLWHTICSNSLYKLIPDLFSCRNYFTAANEERTVTTGNFNSFGYPISVEYGVATAIVVNIEVNYVMFDRIEKLPIAALINYLFGLNNFQKLHSVKPETLLLIAVNGIKTIRAMLLPEKFRELLAQTSSILNQMVGTFYNGICQPINIPREVREKIDNDIVEAVSNALHENNLLANNALTPSLC